MSRDMISIGSCATIWSNRLLLRKGSRLLCSAVFDNSEANPSNPDPTREVTFGEQSWEEMMFGVFQVLEPVDATARASSAGTAP